ncbi:MAG: hypothetical protein V7603_6476 [Micromonosporaceae bacterium]
MWWLVAGLPLAAVLAVGGLHVFGPDGTAAARGAGQADLGLPAGSRARLADRMVTLLEQSTMAWRLAHEHGLGSGATVVCAVDPFGVDPPGAATVAAVRTVYALHLCVVAERGKGWDYSTKSSGPFAARLSEPAQLQFAEPGRGYPDRVRALVPARYQERAVGVFTDRQALVRLRQRFDAIAGR